MKTYILNDLNWDWFKAINDYLDLIETNKEEWQIYINSWWWTIWVLLSIKKRLEELQKKWIKIKLRACFMASSAFDLFYTYKWEKVLEEDCDWIVHTMASEIHVFNINWKVKVRSDDDVERERFKNSKNFFEYDFLTKKEKEKFDEWMDIYLDYERLKKIFKN